MNKSLDLPLQKDRAANLVLRDRSTNSKNNNKEYCNTELKLSTDRLPQAAQTVDLAAIDRPINMSSSKRSTSLLTTDTEPSSHHTVLDDFQIVDLEWRSPFALEHSPIEADYTICVPSGECQALAMLLNPGQAFRAIVSTTGRWLFIGIARRSIEQMLTKLIDRDLKQPVLFDSVIDLSTSFGKSLRSAIEFLVRLADPVAISSALIQSEIESALLACLLKGVKNNYSDEILYQTQGAYACHFQKARSFIESHLHQEIDLAEIAAAVGISPRLLQKVFAQEYDCSPMRFVTQMRLLKIHQELQRATTTDTRITDVMMSYGITQGGKFAKEYQQLFGEKPSDTLKRATQTNDRQPLWQEIDDRRSERIIGGVVMSGCPHDRRIGAEIAPIGTIAALRRYLQESDDIFSIELFPQTGTVKSFGNLELS